MTYRLKFLKIQTVSGPRACIALKTYAIYENDIIISPNCVNFEEFEYQINKIITELGTIKKQGKKFIRESKK